MVKNLVDDPAYADVLKEMRWLLPDWMIGTRDLGIVEERLVSPSQKTFRRVLSTGNPII